MSGLVFRLPLVSRPLRRVQLRARLRQAEAAVDRPFSRSQSLQLDHALLALEQARARKRGLRRVA